MAGAGRLVLIILLLILVPRWLIAISIAGLRRLHHGLLPGQGTGGIAILQIAHSLHIEQHAFKLG